MNPAAHAHAGYSLIEVMVSIVVLSLGLLGMAGLQATSLRAAHGAHYRGQAAQLALDMADRMRANQGAARGYGLPLDEAAPTGTTTADRDRADWRARLAALPGGGGAIEIDPDTALVRITVQWDDSRAGGPADASYVLATRLWND